MVNLWSNKMAKDIWVISDTHLNHYNIVHKFGRNNKFQSVDEMNDYILHKWNSVVKPGDKVYHLGDVFFGSKEWFAKNWPKFHGSKRLIVGNHDDIKYLSQGSFFNKIMMWRMFPDWGLLLTHVPVHPSTLGESRFTGVPMKNVHGHIHQNPSPPGPYKCVCVEQPHMNYTPINIEELRQ